MTISVVIYVKINTEADRNGRRIDSGTESEEHTGTRYESAEKGSP